MKRVIALKKEYVATIIATLLITITIMTMIYVKIRSPTQVDRELDFILWLQSFRSPFIDGFFGFIGYLGKDDFITIVAVVLYWCVSPTLGLRFLLLLLASGYLHTAAKDVFRIPRPVADQVYFLAEPPDGSFAFPSGDTMNATVLFAYLAGFYRRKPLSTVALIAIPLLGLSRIYRGAHLPSDILGGVAMGIALVWFGFIIYRLWDNKQVALSMFWRLALGTVIPVIFFIIYPVPPLTPQTSISTVTMVTGTSLGVIIGYSLERRYVRFPVRVVFTRQLAKVAIGLFLVFLMQMFLGRVLRGEVWLRFIRFALIGFLGTFIVPCIFRTLFGKQA